MVSEEIISDSLITFKKYGSAIAAIPCVEAVFLSDDQQTSSNFIPREKVMRTQTPHTFTLGKLLWMHEEARKKNIVNTTASCTLMSALGEKVYFSKGSEENFKLTTTEDIRLFRSFLKINDLDIGWKLPEKSSGGGYNSLISCKFYIPPRRVA